MDGEIFHIESVNVPFPDEAPEDYKSEFNQNFIKWQEKWANFVLIGAGVIRGSNYT